MSPLRKLRKRRGWSLQKVADQVRELGGSADVGSLSRIERCRLTAAPALAEKICRVFGGELTELQILYPERFAEEQAEAGAGETPDAGTERRRHRGRRATDLDPEQALQVKAEAEALASGIATLVRHVPLPLR
ncbi:helix-turn-helix domain-containing protein [Stutzerimonas nitrititolerans]|uniref:helix-turn-helix domain-containing protein n=1 Tax=Stutzerimonas nitrititolerans TaxID=2482751 RepID=UPI0028ADD7DA|nr:helix-turn-helix transcriptional regulator [Stutzerimonas nitrititolerans]